MLRRIGAGRVGTPGGQQDVLLVYAKAPGEVVDRHGDETYAAALARFEERALKIVQEEEAYYAREEDTADDSEDFIASDGRHLSVGLIFDRDTLHGDGQRIPADRLGYAALRDKIRERVGLRA